ncbi:ABC-ATPase domain-containing protein [Candidatus Formimonas warabiya]|uniref:ATPase n=1 Tax=Formimonas warabiya TaxID=1761012 RepID=A0A3G1KX05_FORW1|nr:ABC-ATPase domain-containing protein [Candidatus Formimonas warabiya]ATW26971.1 ATPase [Candidatus Formimonas warabiya]
MEHLKKLLSKLDGKGYKGYKEIQGTYRGEWFTLHIDYAQSDPFAPPSRIRVKISQEQAKFPETWYRPEIRKTAAEDFFSREIAHTIQTYRINHGGSGKSGLISIDSPGQEVLPRTSVKINGREVEVRLSVGLPAAGRQILGQQAKEMLCTQIPALIQQAIFHFPQNKLIRHLGLADQQNFLRQYLAEHHYVAFVANGSILPRESGISNRPLNNSSLVPFQSPPSLEVEIPLPHDGPIRGMAIPKGITLIVGGGYHGKSTLLKGMERGVYNHVPGDGREYVITDESAVKIRAEDGRSVEKVNISPFISHLPRGTDTIRFGTESASGSTSQAANIMEALEMNARVLLIDEDTSATNFMIRDARMQELVGKDQEPITPFVDRVEQLYRELGVSTVLVMGGSGDYFEAAGTVIMMDEYKPYDVTEKAKSIIDKIPTTRRGEGGENFGSIIGRQILPHSFRILHGPKDKISAKGLHTVLLGNSPVDLSLVEQLVDPSQTRAIADMISYLAHKLVDGKTSLPDLIYKLYHQISEHGLDLVSPFYGQHPGDLALPRKLELAAAINRVRTLKVK